MRARPSSPACGELESRSSNVLVLPLAGVFAKHDGPRRHVIATPNHAVLIAADQPFRLSYPGGIGDDALTLWCSRDLDHPAPAPHTLLTARAMLARSLLWRQLMRGESDPLEIEEAGLELLSAASHVPPRCRGRRPREIERVKEAISLQPERKWTLRELARLAHLSPYHLAHLFREEVGAPVYRYLLRARLAKGLNAVVGTDRDLSAIALETGFASHSHFTARFRALFGLTPAELRKNVTAQVSAAP